MLAARTLIAETELLAANLVRATDGPILLSHASQALAGLGIARLTLRTIVDALVVATGFSGTAIDRTAHPARARLTGLALRLAIPAVVAVDLGIDALVVAHRALVAALALSINTRIPRWADITAAAAVVGVAQWVDAGTAAADVADQAQAAIPGLAVLEHFVIQAVCIYLTPGTGEPHRPIVAEAATGGRLIQERFAEGVLLALPYVAASRSGRGQRRTNGATQQRGCGPPEHPFEYLPSRAGRTQ